MGLFLKCGEAGDSRDSQYAFDPQDGCGKQAIFLLARGWKDVYSDASAGKARVWERPDISQRLCPVCAPKVIEKINRTKEERRALVEKKRLERAQILVDQGCGKCGGALNITPFRPSWYLADQASWFCEPCQKPYCGKCTTANLQKLQRKYQATGEKLKEVINEDREALYLEPELAPFCPVCHANLFRKGRVVGGYE